ncbi:MAG: amino acid ABC transporter ATP-binding protein [Lachnospiraceae bacterium]|nr:amino acid ABC transporter ATP-binding protein [Lachnospiraceae bacterium]
MVELKEIRKSFGDHQILNGVSLTVEEGEVVVILGPSGSGKTTLLRTINFLGPADSGTVTIDGMTVDSKKHHHREVQELRKKTGMVFQNYNLFKNKTVLHNITEGLTSVRKVPKAEAEKTAMTLLEKVNLADRANAYPAELSGGQQQRVGICRALALNPKVILFDEPTSALDPELVGEVLATMRAVAATGITMIVVTHEISFAKEVADKVVYMEEGVIVEQGTPKQVIENPQNEKTIRFLRTLLNNPIEYNI